MCCCGQEKLHTFLQNDSTHFKDWRFIPCARLGLVKYNGYNKPTRANPCPVNSSAGGATIQKLYRPSFTIIRPTAHIQEEA